MIKTTVSPSNDKSWRWHNRICAIDLRVAGSGPAGQPSIVSKKVNFHNVFSVLTEAHVDIPVKFPGPALKLSCADRGVASPDFVPLFKYMHFVASQSPVTDTCQAN